MLREIAIDGIFLPPLLGELAVAAVIWYAAKTGLAWLGAYRFVWHPPLFNTALFVILLGALAAVSL